MTIRFFGVLFLLMISCNAFSQESSKNLAKFLKREVASNYVASDAKEYANMISAFGAVAGYAVQQGLREDLIIRQKIPSNKVFVEVKTKSGKTFYFGDFLNQLLFESKDMPNLWRVLTSHYDGDKSSLPDIDKMAKNNAQQVGGKDFGSHDVEEKYSPTESSVIALQKNWPLIYARLKQERLHPMSWGWEITTFAKSEFITAGSPIPENVAIQIFMESAISMSKFDLINVSNVDPN